MPVTTNVADTVTMVQYLVRTAEPWRQVYSNSSTIPTLVLYAHLAALLLAGGLAISADRATLRTPPAEPAERSRQLLELAGVHRTVVLALACVFTSGVLLLTADLEAFLALRAFWIKMALLVLLLLNATDMLQREKRLRAMQTVAPAPEPQVKKVWSWLRVHAMASLALWFATLLAGTALTAG